MDQQIIETLRKHGGVRLDELVVFLGTAGWPSVFLAVDRLSRSGQVSLQLCGRGEYRVLPVDLQ